MGSIWTESPLFARTASSGAVRSPSRPPIFAASACLARSRSSFLRASATVAESGMGTGSPFFSCTLISLISTSPQVPKDHANQHAHAGDYNEDRSPGAEDYSLRFTIPLILLLQSIGFDRSAFAARPRGAGRQLQGEESSSCSIHAKVFRSCLSKIRNYPSNEAGF